MKFYARVQTSYPSMFIAFVFLGIEFYKCVNGLNPKYMNDMFVIRPNADRFRDSSRAMQPKFSSIGFGFKSFKYFGAKLCNILPITEKQSENLFIYKDRLTEWCHANRSLDILASVTRRFYIVLYSLSYIHHVIGGAAGCHFDSFSLHHIDGGSFGLPEIGVYI